MGFFDALGVLAVMILLLYFGWKWYVYYQKNKVTEPTPTYTPLYVSE